MSYIEDTLSHDTNDIKPLTYHPISSSISVGFSIPFTL